METGTADGVTDHSKRPTGATGPLARA